MDFGLVFTIVVTFFACYGFATFMIRRLQQFGVLPYD